MIPGIQYEEGNGPDQYSWCGYRWDQDGTSYELRYGPESDDHWWEIDDLLWGSFEESYLSAVNEDHTVCSVEQIVDFHINKSGYVNSRLLARQTIEYWWGPLTPSDEVKYGLTVSELDEEHDRFVELMGSILRNR